MGKGSRLIKLAVGAVLLAVPLALFFVFGRKLDLFTSSQPANPTIDQTLPSPTPVKEHVVSLKQAQERVGGILSALQTAEKGLVEEADYQKRTKSQCLGQADLTLLGSGTWDESRSATASAVFQEVIRHNLASGYVEELRFSLGRKKAISIFGGGQVNGVNLPIVYYDPDFGKLQFPAGAGRLLKTGKAYIVTFPLKRNFIRNLADDFDPVSYYRLAFDYSGGEYRKDLDQLFVSDLISQRFYERNGVWLNEFGDSRQDMVCFSGSLVSLRIDAVE